MYDHYIYCHPQTDCFSVSQLFSVARYIGRSKLGSKLAQLFVRLSILPLSQQANHGGVGIIKHYVVAFVSLHFCLTGYQSAQFIRRALHHASGSRKFFRQSVQPPWESVYIVIHRQTVSLYHNYSVWLYIYNFHVQSIVVIPHHKLVYTTLLELIFKTIFRRIFIYR